MIPKEQRDSFFPKYTRICTQARKCVLFYAIYPYVRTASLKKKRKSHFEDTVVVPFIIPYIESGICRSPGIGQLKILWESILVKKNYQIVPDILGF